jgi:predicted ATPase
MEAELIFRRGTPPEAHYLFKHALVRDAAYESMLKAKRVALHHRLLNVMERDGDAAPEVLAQHAEAAGLLERAVDLLERAGTQAIARPAYKEAIASLDHAIRLCRVLGTAPQWRRREQKLFLQLGQALLANQGYSAPATLQAFEHALSLADEIGDADLLIPAVFGQWAGHHIAATGSARYAERFADLVQGRPDAGPHLVALRMLGLERFFEGRFKESLALVDEAIDRYDPLAHADLKLRFGHDPRVAATNYRSWNLWHLGFPDQASQATENNLRLIGEINHPNTTGLALCYGATITNILLRRPDRVEVLARQAIRLSEEMSLALWHAWGQIHLGWALFQQGIAPGLEEIEAGLEEARQIGAGRLRPLHCALASHAYAAAGRHQDAKASIVTAFDALSEGHHVYLTAEVHRMRAGLVLRSGASQRSAVEADLRTALDFARRQGALSLELRAARDLASLLADVGERGQAVDLLAPVFAAFTEGFDSPDLQESKALLDSLST